MIVIGADTHKRSHALAAVDEGTGRVRGARQIKADEAGHLAAVRWARELDEERVWAIEDCRGVSGRLEQALIAAGEEPRVAAVWEDSSYADISVAIRAELQRNGYPIFLEWGGVTMARLLSGDDFASRSPLEAIRRMAGRPVFVTHGTADSRLSVDYARDLIAAAEADGAGIESWIVEGAEHVEGMFLRPDDYEARLVRFFSRALGG